MTVSGSGDDATPTSLAEIERDARALIAAHLDDAWTFGWDRAVKRAGACHHGRARITLSRPLFSIEANRPHARSVILHEIAHAVAGVAAGHGPAWRRTARALGVDPSRCHDLELPPLAVVGSCGCGAPHQRTRLPGRGVRHRCRTCGREVRWRRR